MYKRESQWQLTGYTLLVQHIPCIWYMSEVVLRPQVWLQDFHDIWHMKVVRLSASSTGCLYPQECSWYSFSVGAELTPGP